MDCLVVWALGPLVVMLDGKRVTAFESDKIRALLAYLVVEAAKPHPRESLAEFFWPDRPAGAALSNLRHALTILGRAIGNNQADPPYLLISRQTIQWNNAASFRSDYDQFTRGITHQTDGDAGIASLEEAVALVRGPFLDGIASGDSAALDEWLLLKREELNAKLLHGLNRLAAGAELAGAYDTALDYARRQVELAPWEEQGHQQLMRLLALNDRRSEALAQFKICRQRLAEELAVPPSPETAALYRSIQSGEFKPVVSELHRQYIRGYELGPCIGTGHVGAVYRAYQPVVDRDVAIKIILPQFASRPSFIRRFEAEARTVARLEHPHIVPLYDFWREPAGAYLVMRWLCRGSLHDSLAQGAWPPEAGVRLVDQISSALATAHRQGVIHQDVKPANILLDDADNAYLSDFGIALVAERAADWDSVSPVYASSSLGYLSPESASGGTVTPAADIYSLGVVIFEVLTGRHPFPDLAPKVLRQKHMNEPLPAAHGLRAELPPAVDDVIQRATAKIPGDRFADAPALAIALRQALGFNKTMAAATVEPLEPLANPYCGLRAFQETDAPYFFGRDTAVRSLLEHLEKTDVPNRFLAIVGPSGSGKSSLIRAGLLPMLRAGALPGSENWYTVEMSPGPQLTQDLTLALLGIAAESASDLAAVLASGEQGLLQAVGRVLPSDNSELLLLIDQFEALFDPAVSQEARDRLLDQICTAVDDPGSRLRVIIGLRADYYDRPLAHPRFSQLLGRRTAALGPLTQGELVRAIEGPAQKAGAEFETGLVAQIVADMQDQPGALPVLQYALTELFERRHGRWLQFATYRAMGGISGALVQRAESLFGELDPARQQATRQIFLRLISLKGDTGEPSPAPAARRQVLRSELESMSIASTPEQVQAGAQPTPAAGSNSANSRIIDLFGAARLLTFDRDASTREPTVAVAHEALLWEWPRLRTWLDDSRDQLRMQRLLAHAVREWQASDQDSSFLLHGTRLDQFAQWAEISDLALTEEERSYLDDSLGQRQVLQDAEVARRQREEILERRSRRFLRTLTGVLAVAAIIALLLMLFAFSQQREALRAYSLSLVANAQQAMNDHDTATALILALAASQVADPPAEVRRMLLDVAYAPGARQRYEVSEMFPGSQGPATTLALNSEGQELIVGQADGSIVLWDWTGGREIRRLEGHSAPVVDIAAAPDGRTAISGAEDGEVILWDLVAGIPRQRLDGHAGPVTAVDISADGQRALTAGYGGSSFQDPGQLFLWDVASGQQLASLQGHRAGLVDAHFALDDTAVLASSGDAELLTDRGSEDSGSVLQVETFLWDLDSGEVITRFPGVAHDAFSLAVSPNGQQALIGSYYDNIATLVDLSTGEKREVLEGHHDGISAIQFSGDGRRALTAAHDGSLILWDLPGGSIIAHLKVHQGEVEDVAMTADGRSAFSITRDGELIQWDLHDAADLGRFVGHGDMVYDTAFLPNGKQFLSVSGGSSPALRSQDSSIRLWDLDSGRQLQGRELPMEVIFQVAVTPGGGQALAAGMAPEVAVLDPASLADLGRLEGHQGWVTDIAITADGKHAATASVDGTIIIWDLAQQRLRQRIVTGTMAGLWAVAISPDGRTILADGEPGTIGMWDLASGQQVASFAFAGMSGETGTSGIAFLPDGRSAVAQGANGAILQWDLQSGDLIRVIGQHSDIRTRVEIDPEGDLALSSGMDGILKLWDLKSGNLIRLFGTPGQTIFDIEMSPDGRTALSGSADTTIVSWRIDNPDLEELKSWIASNRYLRDLSCSEHQLYQIEPLCPASTAP